jgi:hypothetical protein
MREWFVTEVEKRRKELKCIDEKIREMEKL